MTNSGMPLQVAIIPVTPFQQNCSIVWCTNTMKGVVIDPGGDLDEVCKAVDETGVKVEKIALTHGHMDHAGGACELRDRLGVTICGPHEGDLFLLETLAETGAAYGIAGARNCTSEKWLDEGDTLSFGDVSFEVHHCPGHSPGSVVYVNKPARLAFVGDVLFQGSIGRSDLPGGNHDQLIRSIREKLLVLDDDVTFISGHGPASTIGHERRHNPFLQ